MRVFCFSNYQGGYYSESKVNFCDIFLQKAINFNGGRDIQTLLSRRATPPRSGTRWQTQRLPCWSRRHWPPCPVHCRVIGSNPGQNASRNSYDASRRLRRLIGRCRRHRQDPIRSLTYFQRGRESPTRLSLCFFLTSENKRFACDTRYLSWPKQYQGYILMVGTQALFTLLRHMAQYVPLRYDQC